MKTLRAFLALAALAGTAACTTAPTATDELSIEEFGRTSRSLTGGGGVLGTGNATGVQEDDGQTLGSGHAVSPTQSAATDAVTADSVARGPHGFGSGNAVGGQEYGGQTLGSGYAVPIQTQTAATDAVTADSVARGLHGLGSGN